MTFDLKDGHLYANNRRICFAKAGIPKGDYLVTTSYCHHTGEVLPKAGEHWFGKDIVVGDAKNHDIIPSMHVLDRIVNIITNDEDFGIKSTLKVC